jgi:arylsulfatase A-like enzyme
MLVLLGLVLFWAILTGGADALLAHRVGYTSTSIAIRFAAASGLFATAVCLLPCLGALGVGRLAARRKSAPRRRTVALIGVQVTAVLVPLTLGAITSLHKSLPADVPATSALGLAMTAGLVVGALLLGSSAWWLAVRVGPSSFGALAAAGYVLLAVVLSILGFGGPHQSSAGTKRPNLLIITIDSLRRDTFDEYVLKHASPVFRRFVSEGRRYQNAHTAFTQSLAAHASMFTGLYPGEHGAVTTRAANGDLVGSPLRRDARTLAEVLGAKGYETAAILTNPWLGPPFGLERGFQTFVNDATVLSVGSFDLDLAARSSFLGPYLRYADRFLFRKTHVNSRLFLGWLRSRDRSRPFFAFLHYLDMHPPNVVEASYAERFCSGPYARMDGRQIQRDIWDGRISRDEMPAVKAQVRALYMAALARMDDFMSPVLEELTQRGWLDDTLVILLADHGENLYEKANSYEKEHVYNTSSNIPFVMRVPGEARGSESDGLVSLVDVPATLYAYCRVEAPGRLEGMSLLQGNPRSADPDGWVYVAGLDGKGAAHARAVLFADGYKYIRDGAAREELYDLRTDPREMHPLLGTGPALSAYRSRFDDIVSRIDAEPGRAVDTESLSRETVEQLKALGYVH